MSDLLTCTSGNIWNIGENCFHGENIVASYKNHFLKKEKCWEEKQGVCLFGPCAEWARGCGQGPDPRSQGLCQVGLGSLHTHSQRQALERCHLLALPTIVHHSRREAGVPAPRPHSAASESAGTEEPEDSLEWGLTKEGPGWPTLKIIKEIFFLFNEKSELKRSILTWDLGITTHISHFLDMHTLLGWLLTVAGLWVQALHWGLGQSQLLFFLKNVYSIFIIWGVAITVLRVKTNKEDCICIPLSGSKRKEKAGSACQAGKWTGKNMFPHVLTKGEDCVYQISCAFVLLFLPTPALPWPPKQK